MSNTTVIVAEHRSSHGVQPQSRPARPQSPRVRRQAEFHGRGTFEKHWPVHMRVPPSQDGCYTAQPLCYNGAYDIRWSANPEEVNCPACKAAMVLRTVNTLRLIEKRITIFEHVNGLIAFLKREVAKSGVPRIVSVQKERPAEWWKMDYNGFSK